MTNEKFQQLIESAKNLFASFDKTKPVRLISHLDADGLSSCSLIIRLLNLEGFKYSVSIVQQLKLSKLVELSKEDYNQFIFTDLGTSHVLNMKKYLPNKKIIVLDHHRIKPEELTNDSNIVNVNPEIVGIDGSKQICGSGVTYMFAIAINPEIKKYAYVAIIGSVGDLQEKGGFSELNTKILDTAIQNGTIKVEEGIRFFGKSAKPLHRLLQYCTDPYLEGITGSEVGTKKFLEELDIPTRGDNGARHLNDLTEEERIRLVDAIKLKLKDSDNENGETNAKFVEKLYVLTTEPEDSPLKDCRDFSTLLNACGRLGKPSLGLGTALGDKELKKQAINLLENYRAEILKSIEWFENNKESKAVIQDKGYIIINTEDNVIPTLAGTLASILSRSGSFEKGTIIVTMAHMGDGTTKVSMRIVGRHPNIDLKQLVSDAVTNIDAETGGHKNAAGAIIPGDKEQEFITSLKGILSRQAMEEMMH